jgi:hypothetical protein
MDDWKNRKRVIENMDRRHQNRLKEIDERKNKALTKLANKAAKDRVVTIAQNLVLSNTISLEELTQLEIQNKTMSEICESIKKKFGKTRLEHLDKNRIPLLSKMDDYERGELIDLSSITRKQLGKGSSGIIDVVKVKERKQQEKQQRKNHISKMKKIMEEEFPEMKVHYDAILSSPTRSADSKKFYEEIKKESKKMYADAAEEIKKESEEFRKDCSRLSSSEKKHNREEFEKISQLFKNSSTGKGNKIDLEKFGKELKKMTDKGSEEDSK